MLKKELLLMSSGDGLYTITIGDNISGMVGFIGFMADGYADTPIGDLSPTTFDGGKIIGLMFPWLPFDVDATDSVEGDGFDLTGGMCFVVVTSKTPTTMVKITRMDTGATVTTIGSGSSTINGEKCFAWSADCPSYNGFFVQSDSGKTIQLKIEYV